MPYVIFSIDNVSDTHALAKFLRHIETQSAMQKMRGKMVHCVGCYKGTLEASFILTQDDFDNHVKPHGFVDNQESILICADDTRQPCFLLYGNGETYRVGIMQEINARDAMRLDAWTYRMDLGKYFAAK